MGGAKSKESAPLYADRANYAAYEGSGPNGKWFTCKADGMMPPRGAPVGPASLANIPATTLPKLITSAAQNHSKKPAFMVERIDGQAPPLGADGKAPPALPEDEWTRWTYEDYLRDIRCAAKGMIKLAGFERFDTVNIWGFNAPEWIIAALASNFAGGKVAGLYPTDTADTAAYKVVHSAGRVVVVETRAQLDKLTKGLAARNDCTRVKLIVAYGFQPKAGEMFNIPGCTCPIISWGELIKKGAAEADMELIIRLGQTEPGHCAALIYTSGTTGDPKAVMISHDNIIYEAGCLSELIGNSTGLGQTASQERLMSYLPLSHVAGMMVDIVMPVFLTNQLAWATAYFARPYDLKVGSFAQRLAVARPTAFLGVPLVWEKIADKIRTIGAGTTGIKKHLAVWAKDKSLRKARGAQLGGSGETPCCFGFAKMLLKPVKKNLGLQECKFGFTGAAPIRSDTLEFFGGLGIQINEVYGMSECTGACTASFNDAFQWGSCGFEMPGIEVRAFKIDEKDMNKKTPCENSPDLDANDEKFMGELCWRGRNNMMGYLANPDLGEEHVKEIEKKTAESIDRDGWLHSGDKGMVTKRGMVKITGRYKEIIIGEGGENIAPVPIEDSIKKLCDGVAEVMMVGDKRKYNVAVVTLKAVGANGESPGGDDLDAGAKRLNPAITTISKAMDDPTWIDSIRQAIIATNKNSKVCINNAFTIQKFTILPMNFSQQNEELTPTQKLKRKVVETRYAGMLDKLYKEKGDNCYVRYSEGGK